MDTCPSESGSLEASVLYTDMYVTHTELSTSASDMFDICASM